MTLVSLYMATNNPQLKDRIPELDSIEEIDEMKEDMLNEHIDTMAEIISKSEDTYDNIYATVERDFKKIFTEISSMYNMDIDEQTKEKILNDIFFDEKMNEKCNGSFSQIEVFYANRIVEVALEHFKEEAPLIYFIEHAQKLVQDTLDDTFKIKSLDTALLANSPLGSEFIKAIDKYIAPSSDEELLKVIQGLQYSDKETVSKFFEIFTFEDVGLDFKSPYSLIQRYNSDDNIVSQAMTEVIGTKIISDNVQSDPESENATAEELYRNLHVKLADMDVQKYVKKFKAEAFQKYKVRQAFPQPVVVTEDAIRKACQNMIKEVSDFVESVENAKYVLDIFKTYETVIKNMKNNEIYNKLINGEDIIITEENEEEVNELYGEYEQLHKLVDLDASLSAMSNITREILNSLVGEDGVLRANEAGTALNKLNNFFYEWNNSGINKERFEREKATSLKNLSTYIQGMINSNVDIPWRNDAIKKANEMVYLMKSYAKEDEIEYAKSELEDYIVEKHITKNPNRLLKQCVKLIQENKTETPEYQVLKHYLQEALKIAQQTKIQYKLVENQHEGINSKIKDMLSLFGVAMNDGSFQQMDSETGMVYLANQLANANENYETLNLFLNQSGLSKRALSAIIKGYEKINPKKTVDNSLEEIYSNLRDIEKLTKVVRIFHSQTGIKFNTLKDALTQLKIFVNRRTQKTTDKRVFDKYNEYLDAIINSDSIAAISPQLIEGMFISVNEDIIEGLADVVNKKIQSIVDIGKGLDGNIEFINAIDIPEVCEEQQLREAFIQECKETQQYIYEKHEELKAFVANSNILTLK